MNIIISSVLLWAKMAANNVDQPQVLQENIDNIVPDLPKLETTRDTSDGKNDMQRSALSSSSGALQEEQKPKRK